MNTAIVNRRIVSYDTSKVFTLDAKTPFVMTQEQMECVAAFAAVETAISEDGDIFARVNGITYRYVNETGTAVWSKV